MSNLMTAVMVTNLALAMWQFNMMAHDEIIISL